MQQMAAEGQSDKMTSDMEEHMKQRCVTEFLHVEKMAPTDIHWHLLNIDGNQTVDVNTVGNEWCVSAVVTAMWKTSHVVDGCAQMSHREMKNASQSAHLHESVDYNQETVYRVEYWLQCIGSDGAVLDYCKVCTRWCKCSHRSGRTPYANFSGPTAPIWG